MGDSDRKWQQRIGIGSLCSILVIAGYFYFKVQSENRQLEERKVVALGQVTCISRYRHYPHVCYQFWVEDALYVARRSGNIPQDLTIGSMGRVEYVSGDPNISRISFEHIPDTGSSQEANFNLEKAAVEIGKCTCGN